jgi:6-pyruvoyltetrahydropterin/6-carboxytetrahydropterin synthase
MYELSIHRAFDAQHYLIGGDWGDENELHTHRYGLEVRISGSALDQHGFLLDIVDLSAHLDALVGKYSNLVLNDSPAFASLNPSIEHFARIVASELAPHLAQPNLQQLLVRISEDDIGWASYTLEL